MCWGANASGQLGAGSTYPFSATPVAALGLADALGITASDAHTCARRSIGEVVCWGRNDLGQLGDASRRDRNFPLRVIGISDAVQIDAGVGHTCALGAMGAIRCWGDNTVGQLGIGSASSLNQLRPLVFAVDSPR
jgi:alpha-tubulin suppressor-like RCC1 family protein